MYSVFLSRRCKYNIFEVYDYLLNTSREVFFGIFQVWADVSLCLCDSVIRIQTKTTIILQKFSIRKIIANLWYTCIDRMWIDYHLVLHTLLCKLPCCTAQAERDKISACALCNTQLQQNARGTRTTKTWIIESPRNQTAKLTLFRASRTSVGAKFSSSKIIQWPWRIAVTNTPEYNERKKWDTNHNVFEATWLIPL